MPTSTNYSCGTCGDQNLVITVHRDYGSDYEWRVTCGVGHEIVPIPATRIEVTVTL